MKSMVVLLTVVAAYFFVTTNITDFTMCGI